MNRHTRFPLVMIAFLLLVGGGAMVLAQPLLRAFMTNVFLNGVILAVFAIGTAQVFRAVLMLGREVAWIDQFRRSTEGGFPAAESTPRLMRPAATMLRERRDAGGKIHLSPTAMQTLLDGVATRLDESRETTRYMVGLLVFLGLLGTFWGLMETIQGIGDVVGDLRIGEGGGDIGDSLQKLKEGLRMPLNGMGMAFSSSLFGLSGSLMLGFLALQAGQAQNLFYRNFENWLSGLTRLGSGGALAMGEASVPAYLQALLEQTADSLDSLQRSVAHNESDRQETRQVLRTLAEKVGDLAKVVTVQQDLMLELASGQKALRDVLTGPLSAVQKTSDAAILSGIEGSLSHIAGDLSRGREELIRELRDEIRLLARTVAASGERRQTPESTG